MAIVELSPPRLESPHLVEPRVRTEARADAPPRELATESDELPLLRGFIRGSIVGAIVVFLVCGIITVAAGFGVGPALGVGAFAAFWGGPGFGGMMGAVLGHEHHRNR